MTLVGLQPLGEFEPLTLLYNNSAVVIGLVYVHLPFMVLPLYSALDRMDRSLMEASLDLGAGHLRTIWSVVVPLAAPGIASGILITFIPALGAYLTPDLLGGTDSQMIANVIERQFKRANDWPFGAALSFLLMYLTFIAIALQAMLQRKASGEADGGDARDKRRTKRAKSPGRSNTCAAGRCGVIVGVTLLFLYLPLITLMVFSFNDSRRNIVWQGFTLD